MVGAELLWEGGCRGLWPGVGRPLSDQGSKGQVPGTRPLQKGPRATGAEEWPAEGGRERAADFWLPRVRRRGGAGGVRGGADPAHRRTALWVPDKGRVRPHPQGTGLARASPGVRASLANHDNTNLVDGARCRPLLSRLGCGGRGRRGLLGPGLLLKRREMAISTSSGHSLAEEAAETGTDFKGASALKPRSSALPRSQVLQVLEPPPRNTPQAACVLEGLETETFLPRGMLTPKTWRSGICGPLPTRRSTQMHVVCVLPLEHRSQPRERWGDRHCAEGAHTG